MKFKNLPIKEYDIIEVIASFASGTVYNTEDINLGKKYLIDVPNLPQAIILMYPKNNGKISLDASSGKNPDLSHKIATHVKENCKTLSINNEAITTKMSDKKFNFLLENLKNDNVSILHQSDVKYGSQYRIEKKGTGSLVIKRYDTGTVVIQGSSEFLMITIKKAIDNLSNN